jgi:hypothetical protein
MEQFIQWFINIFKTYWTDLGETFKSFFVGLYQLFVGNLITYGKEFLTASKVFTNSDWAIAIPSLIIVLFLHISVIIIIFMLLRKYMRFVKKEHDKEDLQHEVAALNGRVEDLIDEKNAILALSGGNLAGQGGSKSSASKNSKNRFVRLNLIDEKYDYSIFDARMKTEDKITLSELVERFVNFSAYKLNLYYDNMTIATFFAGMAASKTMILEGISGTGKTSLPYAMGKFFLNDSHIISVQPSWRDRAEMLGYLNDFTKKFSETEFLASVYETTYRNDINFVVLDEMNLARVEYYFADFLSLLEMPHPSEWLVDLVPDQTPSDPMHFKEGKLLIPQNLWFVGTANRDDSTFTITDKVYDRASSIEMNTKAVPVDAPPTDGIRMSYNYLSNLFEEAKRNFPVSEKALDNLDKIDKYITENFQITFGNRITKQIKDFIPVFVACGCEETAGLDYLVSRKILRKFESLNLPFLQKELENLNVMFDKLFGKNKFQECKKMIVAYIKQI